MEGVLGWLLLIGLIGGWVMYGNWLRRSISERSIDTKLPPEQLRRIFTEKVARAGWKIVDDGAPMVAQSSLVTGIRQQISLHIEDRPDGSRAVIRTERWVTSWGVPKKAHTLRLRMNSFVSAVSAADPAADTTTA